MRALVPPHDRTLALRHGSRRRHPRLPRPHVRGARRPAGARRGAVRRRPDADARAAARSRRSAPARLGLSTAIAAPLGRDAAGDIVRAALAAEGVELVERSAARTPTTVVFPVSGDRAMVTVDPGVRASAADVAGLAPRAVALSLDQLYAVPEACAAYVTVGDDDARAYAGRPPALLGRARALFVNQREALGLTSELHHRRRHVASRGDGRHRDRDARRRRRDRRQRGRALLGGRRVRGGAHRHDRGRRPARERVHLGRPARRPTPARRSSGRCCTPRPPSARPPASAVR